MEFRTDLNGLRAIAVVVVVLYHLGVPGFRGGYVGVDVFFVISGYLMTQVILGKLVEERFSLVDFYAARARRLVPSLLLLTAALLLVGSVLLLPLPYVELAESIESALSFTSNIVFWREQGYFDTPSQAKWLLHTWSLSVEWQFYLLYPLYLMLLVRLRHRVAVPIGLALAILASLTLAVVATPIKPTASFFLLPTRVWELVLGGAVYLRQREHATARPALAYLGMALIALATLSYQEGFAYPGAWAVVPVVGSAIVILARGASSLLGNRLAQHLGDTSYSFYLWHWPVIVAARALEVPFTIVSEIGLALLSYAMALAAYRLVEVPFRRRGATISGARYLAATACALAVVGAAAALVVMLDGAPQRIPDMARRNDAVAGEFIFADRCGEREECAVGAAAERKVLFWGDSHAEHLFPAVSALVDAGRTRGAQPVFYVHSNCIPVRNLGNRGHERECLEYNERAFARASQADVDTVVIASIWMPYFRKVYMDDATGPTVCRRTEDDGCAHFDDASERPAALAAFEEQLLADVRALTNAGKRVLLMAQVPIFDRYVARHLAMAAWHGTEPHLSQSRAQHDERSRQVRQVLDDVARETGALVLDPANTLCHGGQCIFAIDGVAAYRDNNHLSSEAARLLIPLVEAAFD